MLRVLSLASTRRRARRSAALGGAAALIAPAARAQLVDQYFPASLPGYANDLTLAPQSFDRSLQAQKGIEVGDFDITPSLSENLGYDTSPLGSFGRGSATVETTGVVTALSDGRRAPRRAPGSRDTTVYPEESIANTTNWTASLGGGLDVDDERINLAYSHLAEHLAATELGTIGIVAPLPYADDDVRLDTDVALGQFRIDPSFDFQNVNFGASGGTDAGSYGVRDHDIYSGTLTGLYELSRGTSLVAIVRGTRADYAGTGASSNSYDDVLGFGGVQIPATALLQVEALVGAEYRSFTVNRGQTIATPTAEFDALYRISKLTTLTATLGRRLEDPTSLFESTQATTEGRFALTHELRRDVTVSAFVDVGASQYSSSADNIASTTQVLTNTGVTVAWHFNRLWSLTFNDTFSANDYGKGASNWTGTALAGQRSYVANSVSVGLTLSR